MLKLAGRGGGSRPLWGAQTESIVEALWNKQCSILLVSGSNSSQLSLFCPVSAQTRTCGNIPLNLPMTLLFPLTDANSFFSVTAVSSNHLCHAHFCQISITLHISVVFARRRITPKMFQTKTGQVKSGGDEALRGAAERSSRHPIVPPFTVQSAPDPLHASYFTKCFLPFHAHMRPMKLLKGWLWKVVDSINTGRWFLMSTSKTNLSLNKMYVSKTAFFLPLLKRDLIFRRGKLMSSFTLIALLLEQIGARSHEVAFHADYRLKLSLSVFSFSLPFKNMLPRQQGGGFFLCGKCDLRWLRQN